MSIIIRSTFTPNDPAALLRHQAGVVADIGPWLTDYAEEIAKPAVDLDFEIVKRIEEEGS